MALTLFSLNIEGSLHLERFPKCIAQHKPDIVCLQEVCDYDLARISDTIGYPHYYFVPKIFLPQEHPIMRQDGQWGIALFSKKPLHNVQKKFYAHADLTLAKKFLSLSHKDDDRQRAMDGVVLFGTYIKDGVHYTVGTTHFTWSFIKETPLQQKHARALMRIIAEVPDMILCGDFNVPRGQNACYEIFTKGLIDAIPQRYTSSIDKTLHKNGDKIVEDLMVDYIFHTPQYALTHVKLHDGVSDHKAITATITRKI